jgi:hypothetical protein
MPGPMTRILFSIFLIVAAFFLGALPHEAMASGSSEPSAVCFDGQTAMLADRNLSHQCGAGDRSMVGACAVGCHGPAAVWAQFVDMTPMEFSQASAWTSIALTLPGRLTNPADRPPKII